MKKWGKFEVGILLFFLLAFGLNWLLTASGVVTPKQRVLAGGELSFDFTQADTFFYDFSGSRFEWVTVKCTACEGARETDAVHVVLYIDEKGDGNYTATDHYEDLAEGYSTAMRLPENRKNCRFVFSCPSGGVKQADFVVKSGQPDTSWHLW